MLVPQRKYDRVRGRQRFNKVVRDNIPQTIAAKGERVRSARLADGDGLVALIAKLFEEALELKGAAAPAEQLEELADVLEVVRGIAVAAGLSWDDVQLAAKQKREKRGGFEQQTVLLETTRPMPSPNARPHVTWDDGERVVLLRDLGTVTVDGANASVSFSKLLSGNPTVLELNVNGLHLNLEVAVDAVGLRVSASDERRPNSRPHTQDFTLFEGATDTTD